VVTQYC